MGVGLISNVGFQSTPSSQKATRVCIIFPIQFRISIHTFFSEGDFTVAGMVIIHVRFQSTPSSQKATITVPAARLRIRFQSTPSSQKATVLSSSNSDSSSISIHTFFAEGDRFSGIRIIKEVVFQSTPSSQKATNIWLFRRQTNRYFNPHLLRRRRRCLGCIPH